jgi:ATPase, P-type (transporting), HAD superfamily, subfamily IC
MNFIDYACKTFQDLEKEFGTSLKLGLSDDQLIINKNKYGQNVLTGKEKTWLDFLLDQYESPIILLLIGAAYLSLFLGENINAVTIFCIVLINTSISFYQEYAASQQVKLLKKYLEQTSKVIRNGKEIVIESKKLFPGDIVIFGSGDHITADVRFVEANSLSVDESALSGESLPVMKKSETSDFAPKNIFCASNIGFSGTVVVSGIAKGVVFAIGQKTSFGKISEITTTAVHETKFFKNIKNISYLLLKMIAVTLIFLIILHVIFKPSSVSISELFMFAVALALGIAPEALPSITTLSLSRGAILLARNKVIVKRLSSIEDFGGLEIICTDKTGTITENQLTIHDINSPNYDYKRSVFYMSLSSLRPFEKLKRPFNPFDSAAWDKLAPTDFELLAKYERIDEIPFDSMHRRNLVLVKNGFNKNEKEFILIVNGDYEEVAARSRLAQEEKIVCVPG